MVVGRVQFLRGCWKEGLRPQPALAGGHRHALPLACHLPTWPRASSEPAKERVRRQGGSLCRLKSDGKNDRPHLCHALLVSSKSGVQATLKGRTLQGVTTKKRGSQDHPRRYPPHSLSVPPSGRSPRHRGPAARRRLTATTAPCVTAGPPVSVGVRVTCMVPVRLLIAAAVPSLFKDSCKCVTIGISSF